MPKKDRPPKGGWLGPPPTEGLKPLGVMKKGGRFEKVKQTPRDRELRRKWEKRMAKADEKGVWRFKWPPKD